MALSTPVVAAIVGSIVAGVISFIVNILSILLQYRLNKRDRQRANREQWEREVISLVRYLRRKAIAMDVSNDNIEEIDDIIDDIEFERDRIPPKYKDTDIDSALSDILVQHSQYQSDTEDRSLPSYRGDMIEKSEDFLNLIEEKQ